jgi:hypothetical protein
LNLPLPLPFFFPLAFLVTGNSSVGSNPWCIHICMAWIFISPFSKKKAFPQHTRLVMEDWAALGLVGGRHKVLQTKQPTHPQITTRTKCMLPEAVEKITWALHRTEAPRPMLPGVPLSHRGSRSGEDLRRKIIKGPPNSAQVGLSVEPRDNPGACYHKLQIKCQRVS